MPASQGARRFGSTEAPPIDWIIPPHRRTGSAKDEGLSEIFAYHATTVGAASPGLLPPCHVPANGMIYLPNTIEEDLCRIHPVARSTRVWKGPTARRLRSPSVHGAAPDVL